MTHSEIRVIQFVHDDFEDLELWYPVYRLREFGAIVHLVGDKALENYKGKHGVPATSDFAFTDVNPEIYDVLLVPGGWAPDRIRRDEHALKLVQYFDANKKIIGTICHGGWVLISAGVLKNRKMTSVPAIKDDVENAGAQWSKETAVRDENLISAQRPPDLPAYMALMIEAVTELKKSKETAQ